MKHFARARISLVLAGGVVAALLGPWLARWGGPLLQTAYMGSFLLLSLVSALAAGLLLGLKVPQPAAAAAQGGRSLAEIVRQPAYLVALFGAATGYGVMILAMTATPLAMVHHQHHLSDTTTVIQMHVLGMFVPSFFTGSLIARFGVLPIMLAGVALLAGHVLISLTGTDFHSFAGALVPAGRGLELPVHRRHNPADDHLHACREGARAGRQRHDDLRRGPAGLARRGAAAAVSGWQTMNLVLLPWLAIAAVALMGLGMVRRLASP